MKHDSKIDRLILRGIAFCFVATFLIGCMASIFSSFLSHTVKATAKVASSAARITADSARAATHTITKPFC